MYLATIDPTYLLAIEMFFLVYAYQSPFNFFCIYLSLSLNYLLLITIIFMSFSKSQPFLNYSSTNLFVVVYFADYSQCFLLALSLGIIPRCVHLRTMWDSGNRIRMDCIARQAPYLLYCFLYLNPPQIWRKQLFIYPTIKSTLRVPSIL